MGAEFPLATFAPFFPFGYRTPYFNFAGGIGLITKSFFWGKSDLLLTFYSPPHRIAILFDATAPGVIEGVLALGGFATFTCFYIVLRIGTPYFYFAGGIGLILEFWL